MFGEVAEYLAAALSTRCSPSPERSVHGGSINDCYRWRTDAGPVFVKITERARLAMFESEADGLRELASSNAVRVPRVLALGTTSKNACLALEWIEPAGGRSRVAEAQLGRQLAAQHRVTAERFGWHRDNTIGLTPQINTRSSDWLTFFREHRLRYQLDLVAPRHPALLSWRCANLLSSLDEMLAGHAPQPSLLHGDLWGGNWFATPDDVPVIFDPAVYFGDREADLAMTHLFGGFSAEFYRAYEAAWPLSPGHEERRDLYNLYHVLNHAHLFGGGYVQQACAIIDRLLAGIRR